MLTILAYLIVVILSQFAFTISGLVATPLLGLIFSFLKNKCLPSFLTGISMTIGAFYFGYLIFHWFGIEYSYWQFAVSFIGILAPLYNDYKMYSGRIIENNKIAGKDELDLMFGDSNKISRGIMTGQWAGLILAFILLFKTS